MARYDFECAEHGVFEEVRKMADSDKPAACPECGGEARKILTRCPAIQMKKYGQTPQESVDRYIGEKRPHHIVPDTKEKVVFEGPKSGWRRQAYNAYLKKRPDLKYKNFHLTNT